MYMYHHGLFFTHKDKSKETALTCSNFNNLCSSSLTYAIYTLYAEHPKFGLLF